MTKTNVLKDKNGIEIRTGQIVKIEGSYFKSSNGNFKVIYSPGDSTWSGNDYCICKVNKNGSMSKSKDRTQFWPLMVTVSSREKRALAGEHNEKYATIEIVSESTPTAEKQLDEMSKDELFETFNLLLEEKGIQDIDGIWKNSTKSKLINAIDCLNCTDKKLDEYLEIVKKEYPNLVKSITENPINFKNHDFNRLHIYNTAKMLEAKEITEEEIEEPEKIEEIRGEEEEKTAENTNMAVEISFNEEKSGIEIKFDGKPEREILENLKANGFRWSKYQKIWYAKDTIERRKFIKQFQNGVTTESEPKIFKYPEIDIDDLEDYTIDSDLSRRENDGNWIFRTKERNHTEEIQSILKKYQDEAIEILGLTDNKEIIYYLKRDLQRFKKAYHSNYIAILTNKANNPSWAVTGRAGRNAGKDQKANDRYNKLLCESAEIVEQFEKSLSKNESKIWASARKKTHKKIEDTEMELDFKVETKEIDKRKVRTYNYKNYMIVKIWGCYRIFKNGREIKDLRSTDTLKIAKKALQLIINDESQKLHEAI